MTAAKTLAQLPLGGALQSTDLLLIERAGGISYSIYGSVITSFNPMSALGDIIVGTTGGLAQRLGGNTSGTAEYLRSTGSGGDATLPQWSQVSFSQLAGNIAVNQMNSGSSASNSTFWRGDNTWQPVASAISLNPSVGSWTNVGTPTITSSGFQVGNMVFYTITITPATSISTTAGTSVLFVTPAVGAEIWSGFVTDLVTLAHLGDCISDIGHNWIDMPTIAPTANPILISGFFSLV